MKITFEILGIVLLVVAAVVAVRYFLEKRRAQVADQTGVVVYATFVSSEPVKVFGKVQAGLAKINLHVQEPGETTGRSVTLQTRVDPSQKLTPGAKVAVVIDPKDRRRVYPASTEAARRVVLTGSRQERRQMKAMKR